MAFNRFSLRSNVNRVNDEYWSQIKYQILESSSSLFSPHDLITQRSPAELNPKLRGYLAELRKIVLEMCCVELVSRVVPNIAQHALR